MIRHDAGTTSPALLNRLGDWRDRDAWLQFLLRYDPFIRSCCRRFGLDADLTEELCQRIWIDLARRMRTFRYDPGKTFRGWLRSLCASRAIDLLRKRAADPLVPLATEPYYVFDPSEDEPEEPNRLLEAAAAVQEAVRGRVGDKTWRVFWILVVEGLTVREACDELGMTYYAAFAARKRVLKMLKEEGKKLLNERRSPAGEFIE